MESNIEPQMGRRAGLFAAGLALFTLLSILLLQSCGTQSGSMGDSDSRISLSVLPGTDLRAGSLQLGETATLSDGSLAVPLLASNVERLSAVFVALDYPADLMCAQELQSAAAFGGAGRSIGMLKVTSPGHLEAGQVQLGASPSGFSGSGLVATIVFAPRADGAHRVISAVPGGPACRAELDVNAGSLTWYFQNAGDYNQDSQVGVADLTPIGQFFGATGPFEVDSARFVTDGNGDGVINVSDLTPIGANYGHIVSGYRLYSSSMMSDYPADPMGAGGPGASYLGYIDLSLANGGGMSRKAFIEPLSVPGDYYWVRATNQEGEGICSNLVTGSGPIGNQPPTVTLVCDRAEGPAPLLVHVTANPADSDGTIAKIEFDLDGDSIYETDNGTNPASAVTFDLNGAYSIGVRVTDDDGSTAVASQGISVHDALGLPPVIFLDADVVQGSAPLEVNFDVSSSMDLDGTVESFSWDFNSDGIADFIGPDVAVQRTFTSPGTYLVKVTGFDNDGNFNFADKTITVNP